MALIGGTEDRVRDGSIDGLAHRRMIWPQMDNGDGVRSEVVHIPRQVGISRQAGVGPAIIGVENRDRCGGRDPGGGRRLRHGLSSNKQGDAPENHGRY